MANLGKSLSSDYKIAGKKRSDLIWPDHDMLGLTWAITLGSNKIGGNPW